MADGAGLNEGFEDGDAEEEGDSLSCNMTVFVTTSTAAVFSNECDIPRAAANATTRRNTRKTRSRTRGCFCNGRAGSACGAMK